MSISGCVNRSLFELFGPFFCHQDGFLLDLHILDAIPRSICMLYHCLDLLWILGVPDVEEVGPVTLSSLWIALREKL